MPRLGILSKLYVNGGTWDVPVLNELITISDCNVDGSWEEGEASARASRIGADEPTILRLEITGKVRVADALGVLAYNAMYNAYFKDLPIDVLVLNGARTENGASGYRALFKIFTWSEDQSLGAVLFKDFSMKPCIPAEISPSTGAVIYRFPKVANVVAGNVVYSDIGLGV